MKKPLISLLLMITVATGYAQQVKQLEPISAEMYRKKSKGQRTTALVLGGIGFVTSIYGLSNFQIFGDEQEKFYVPFTAGSILLISTIPFIIAADRNNKKAKKLSTSLMLQRTPPLVAAIQSTTCYPSVSIRIQF